MKSHKLIDRFLAGRRAQGVTAATVEAYRWALARLPAELPDRPEPLEDVLAAADLAPESIRDIHRVWRTFFAWAAPRYGVPNPMALLPKPRAKRRFPRVFSRPELDAIWRSCGDQLDRCLVAVALGCGLRLAEISSLTWSDVGAGEIRVSGKTGDRYLPLPQIVQELLVGLGDLERIWIGRRGPLSRNGVKQRLERIVRRAHIRPPKCGPHTFRHTFASAWIRHGGNVFDLQALMGHASVSTTMLYVHMNRRDLAAAMDLHSPARILEELTQKEA